VGVAPRAGAWVETFLTTNGSSLISVAPRAGAWVETGEIMRWTHRPYSSHPVRVRGLKPIMLVYIMPIIGSHPVRVRGLKPQRYLMVGKTSPSRTPCGCVG